MKTAVVHDWLVSLGGGERVLDVILELYPSPLYTLLKADKNITESFIQKAPVTTSFIQKLPFAATAYRNYLPLFPFAIERFDLAAFDLILSSSHAVAKGVKTHSDQLHICYCYTPMRYIWDLSDQYTNPMSGWKAQVAKTIFPYLRKWDIKTAHRVDHFIAISHYVAERINRLYQCPAEVIYPPVSTHLFNPERQKEEFYLTVSRFVPYKRIDLIVEAFAQMPSKRLFVIGEGPEEERIRSKAGANVTFLGFQPDEVVRDYLERAKGFVFAAEEEFGILPVEAQAAGTPVIAYGKGGVTETVISGVTGLFFDRQEAGSLIEAVERFEKMKWDSSRINEHSHKFGLKRFKREYKQFVEKKWEAFCENRHSSRR
jgi:glycosyltransferase involved in cell wall biosynthesis